MAKFPASSSSSAQDTEIIVIMKNPSIGSVRDLVSPYVASCLSIPTQSGPGPGQVWEWGDSERSLTEHRAFTFTQPAAPHLESGTLVTATEHKAPSGPVRGEPRCLEMKGFRLPPGHSSWQHLGATSWAPSRLPVHINLLVGSKAWTVLVTWGALRPPVHHLVG